MKKMMIVSVVAAHALIWQSATASSIQWDNIEINNGSAAWGYYSITYPYVSMQGNFMGETLLLWAEPYDYMEIRSSWCVVNAGDLISVQSVSEAGTWFYRSDFAVDDLANVNTDYPIELTRGTSVYLAAICSTYTAPDNYSIAWMELTLGDVSDIRLVHSALATDGQSLIVGATPEPTGAMLALVGMAVLASRRKCWLRGDLELEVTK